MSNFTDISQVPKYKRVLFVSPDIGFAVSRTNSLVTQVVKTIKKIIEETFKPEVLDVGNYRSQSKLGYKHLLLLDPSKYDAVVMINAAFNFMGGVIPEQFYYFMNFMKDFHGDVWMYIESFFSFKPSANIVKTCFDKLSKKQNIKYLPLFEKYKPHFEQLFSNINYMCDGDLIKMCQKYERLNFVEQKFRDKKIKIVKTNMPKMLAAECCCPKADFDGKKYDISFATVHPERFPQGIKYLDDKDLSIEAIYIPKRKNGKIEFNYADAHYINRIGNLKLYYRWICKNCRASYLSMAVDHTSNLKPERLYGCLMSDIVPMIPTENDPTHSLLQTKELADFCYVSSKSEMVEKLKKLRDKEFYNHIIELQRKEILADNTKETNE